MSGLVTFRVRSVWSGRIQEDVAEVAREVEGFLCEGIRE